MSSQRIRNARLFMLTAVIVALPAVASAQAGGVFQPPDSVDVPDAPSDPAISADPPIHHHDKKMEIGYYPNSRATTSRVNSWASGVTTWKGAQGTGQWKTVTIDSLLADQSWVLGDGKSIVTFDMDGITSTWSCQNKPGCALTRYNSNGHIVDTDIIINVGIVTFTGNANDCLTDTPSRPMLSIHEVMLHEMAHSFGLAVTSPHSNNNDSVVTAANTRCHTKDTMVYDLALLKDLYARAH